MHPYNSLHAQKGKQADNNLYLISAHTMCSVHSLKFCTTMLVMINYQLHTRCKNAWEVITALSKS